MTRTGISDSWTTQLADGLAAKMEAVAEIGRVVPNQSLSALDHTHVTGVSDRARREA
jgi:hypothetical protein